MGEFSGKTVLITGAAQGVGRQTAIAFAEEGSNVFMTDIKVKELKFLENDLRANGCKVDSMGFDISIIQSTKKVIDTVLSKYGSIDLQLLGIGANGHIAFNEPGSALNSRTRVVDLNQQTIKDNARFFQTEENVPSQALTMGVGTILEAKKIVLLAVGPNKAEAISKAVNGMITTDVPASFLRYHPDCLFIIDKASAAML